MFYQLFNFVAGAGVLAVIGNSLGLHSRLFAEINSAFTQVVSMFPF